MLFAVDAVTPDAFAGWANATKAAGPALDASAYRALARQGGNVQPFTYRAVQPNLFQRW